MGTLTFGWRTHQFIQVLIEWANFYGGTDADVPMRVRRVSGGGYIMVGYSNSTDGQVIGQSRVALTTGLCKTDNDGNLLWAKILWWFRTMTGQTDVIPLDRRVVYRFRRVRKYRMATRR